MNRTFLRGASRYALTVDETAVPVEKILQLMPFCSLRDFECNRDISTVVSLPDSAPLPGSRADSYSNIPRDQFGKQLISCNPVRQRRDSASWDRSSQHHVSCNCCR